MVLFAAELLTNAVEWLGLTLGLGEGAVGSVLAALGTALPETAVPVTALVLRGGREAEQVGIGGILGAPFLLVTLGSLMLALSAVLLRTGRARREIAVSADVFARDLVFFTIGFSLALVPAIWPARPVRLATACALVGSYVAFVAMHVRAGRQAGSAAKLKPLYLQRGDGRPHLTSVLFQLVAALALVVCGAHLLTKGVEVLSARVQLPAFLLSALIVPIATELPETLNSVVWMREGKDGLAVGNVTGAMVFQGTLVPAIGVMFTDWTFSPAAWWAAALTLAAALLLMVASRQAPHVQIWPLLLAASGYFAFPLVAFPANALSPPARLALMLVLLGLAVQSASMLVRRRAAR